MAQRETDTALYPYLIAINQGNEKDRFTINKLINSKIEDRVNQLISVFETINVKEKTEEMIANYFEKAKENLADITDSNPIHLGRAEDALLSHLPQ